MSRPGYVQTPITWTDFLRTLAGKVALAGKNYTNGFTTAGPSLIVVPGRSSE
jgi:hypothetical protein